jgi:hypothetical protein
MFRNVLQIILVGSSTEARGQPVNASVIID